MVPPKDLKPHPRNPNEHPDNQIKALCASIKRFGWRNKVTVSLTSGFIVSGHARVLAALALGVDCPVEYQVYRSEQDELDYVVADNCLAELARRNTEALDSIIKEAEATADRLLSMGFEMPPGLDTSKEKGSQTGEDEVDFDKAAELQREWSTELGQIWQLGDHRLMCGDSTNRDNVEQLLDSGKPLLMVTDPLYGVEYDAAWRDEAAKHSPSMGNRKDSATGRVKNDTRADWSEAWSLFPGDVAYVWHAGLFSSVVFESLVQNDFIPRAQIIWAKNHLVIGRGDYHYQHEPCWYAVRKGKKGLRTADRTQTTLWNVDKPQKSETGHSTQKPVECMARPIRNHESELIYDPFCGSGTTIIACEQLGRKCRAMELHPGYVAMALKRYTEMTGQKPTLLGC